jgi:hypothetical protein
LYGYNDKQLNLIEAEFIWLGAISHQPSAISHQAFTLTAYSGAGPAVCFSA